MNKSASFFITSRSRVSTDNSIRLEQADAVLVDMLAAYAMICLPRRHVLGEALERDGPQIAILE